MTGGMCVKARVKTVLYLLITLKRLKANESQYKFDNRLPSRTYAVSRRCEWLKAKCPSPNRNRHLEHLLVFFYLIAALFVSYLIYFFIVHLATEVESIAQRKKNINDSYNEVVNLAKVIA